MKLPLQHIAGLAGLALIGFGCLIAEGAPPVASTLMLIGAVLIVTAAVLERDPPAHGDDDDNADSAAHLAFLAQREREDEADQLHAEACMRLGISHPDFVERRQ